MSNVAEVDEVDAAIELIVERRPDVDLLDVHLPWAGGRAVIEIVMSLRPNVRFLALSVSDAAEDVLATIRAGVRGNVTKAISGPELADAVRRVAGGDAVFSPRLAGFVLDAFTGRAGVELEVVGSLDPELYLLTPGERQVLCLVARGYSSKSYREVAGRLGSSTKTVKPYLGRSPQTPAIQSTPTQPVGIEASLGLRRWPVVLGPGGPWWVLLVLAMDCHSRLMYLSDGCG